MDDVLIKSMEMVERTGISYRQLNYWVGRKLVESEGGVGSGNTRYFPTSQIPIVRLLGLVSKWASKGYPQQGLQIRVLRDLVDAYGRGEENLDLGNGVTLSWSNKT